VAAADIPAEPGITMIRGRTSTDALIERSRIERGMTLIASSSLPRPRSGTSANTDMMGHLMDDEVTRR